MKLLPCPFCNGTDTQIVTKQWKGTKSFETFVLCGPCQIRGPSCVCRDNPKLREANAADLWNTRAQPSEPIDWEKLRTTLYETVWSKDKDMAPVDFYETIDGVIDHLKSNYELRKKGVKE